LAGLWPFAIAEKHSAPVNRLPHKDAVKTGASAIAQWKSAGQSVLRNWSANGSRSLIETNQRPAKD
jgi:hypothetical protein